VAQRARRFIPAEALRQSEDRASHRGYQDREGDQTEHSHDAARNSRGGDGAEGWKADNERSTRNETHIARRRGVRSQSERRVRKRRVRRMQQFIWSRGERDFSKPVKRL